jgi:hypothetical protein
MGLALNIGVVQLYEKLVVQRGLCSAAEENHKGSFPRHNHV